MSGLNALILAIVLGAVGIVFGFFLGRISRR